MHEDSVIDACPTGAEFKNFSYRELVTRVSCTLAGGLAASLIWIITAQSDQETDQKSKQYNTFRASVANMRTVSVKKGEQVDVPNIYLLFDGVGGQYNDRRKSYGKPVILFRAGLPNGTRHSFPADEIPESNKMWTDINLFTELGIPYRLRVTQADHENMECILTPYQLE